MGDFSYTYEWLTDFHLSQHKHSYYDRFIVNTAKTGGNTQAIVFRTSETSDVKEQSRKEALLVKQISFSVYASGINKESVQENTCLDSYEMAYQATMNLQLVLYMCLTPE